MRAQICSTCESKWIREWRVCVCMSLFSNRSLVADLNNLYMSFNCVFARIGCEFGTSGWACPARMDVENFHVEFPLSPWCQTFFLLSTMWIISKSHSKDFDVMWLGQKVMKTSKRANCKQSNTYSIVCEHTLSLSIQIEDEFERWQTKGKRAKRKKSANWSV